MTAWTPVYRIKVDNTEVTDVTLSGLTITSGRTDIYSQPVAGYCNMTLVKTDQSAVSFDINDGVSIEVQDNFGNYVFLFGGSITDVNVIVATSISGTVTQRIQIIATGALARLARAIYTGNISSAHDGTQIAELLSTVLFDTWNEVSASLTWATYDATTTWANAQNSGYGEIDTPGNYDLDSQNNLNATVYSIVTSLATSGLGYLYEDAEGRIGYADSTHRSEYLSTNGYVDLSGNHAIGPNLQISKKAGDVRNAITIAYGSAGNSSVSDSDAASIATYGQLAATIRTTLKNQTDAEAQAAYYLDIRALPQYQFKQITFPLANSEIDTNDRTSLLNVFMGMPVNIADLPANMVGGYFQGFVEGWTWTANMNSLTLILTVSPVDYSLQAMRWSSVPATEYWNTINPTLDWANATIVA
jgi:hypothetical protein